MKRKTLSEETITLRREIDKSGKVSKSMVDWTTSEHEGVRELKKSNNIALQLSLDRSESLVKRLPQQVRELQDTVHVLQDASEFKDLDFANSEVSGRTFKE